MSRPELGQDRLFTPPPSERLTLAEKFLVPPFTILDARAGYWRERKVEWANLGIEPELGNRAKALLAEELGAEGMASGEGRGDNLLSGATVRQGYGGDYDTSKGENAWGGSGTSIFDPVLCELAYRWFTPQGGLVLDPFAGGSVRGIVAATLERRYLGVDLRAEQVEANRAQAQRIGAALEWASHGHWPEWVEGDARHVRALAPDAEADFIFSCPPYYDLEVYSDDPRDLSKAPDYGAFRAAYHECIVEACQLLRPDRFAAFVVGEVRGKGGHYVGLVPDTVYSFKTAGLELWNEAILVTAVGSLPIRASRTFGPARKLGKAHQQLLVFVKGDGRKAAEACGPLLEVALEQGGAVWRTDGSLELEETGESLPAFTGEEPGA